MDEGRLVFVYGTLKRGHCNHRSLAGATFIGEVETEPKYELFEEFLPFMVYGTERVAGEVYMVSDEQLARLDRLEGHPHLYKRTDIEVRLKGAGSIVVQAYLFQKDLVGAMEVDTRTPSGAQIWGRRE